MDTKLEEGSRIIATTSWGAIVAGVAIALALQLLLLTLGFAVGASVGDHVPGGGYAWWAFLVQLLTLAIGGAVAARVSPTRTRLGGMVAGGMTWAFAIAIGEVLGSAVAVTRLGSTGLWSAFFGMLLGLGAAMFGGLLGATRRPTSLPVAPLHPQTPAHSVFP